MNQVIEIKRFKTKGQNNLYVLEKEYVLNGINYCKFEKVARSYPASEVMHENGEPYKPSVVSNSNEKLPDMGDWVTGSCIIKMYKEHGKNIMKTTLFNWVREKGFKILYLDDLLSYTPKEENKRKIALFYLPEFLLAMGEHK